MAGDNPGGARWEWVVDAVDAGQRLDHFLTKRAVLGSRSQVTRLIAAGSVSVDGRTPKPGAVLRAGARVVAVRAVAPSKIAVPEAIELDVLYEDESVLAINKPPGLVVHPAPGHWQGTLVNALLHRWASAAASDLDPDRLGLVHRLDKDTSGVLLIARTAAALTELSRQFKQREVTKRYLALVSGVPRQAHGVIDKPIGRHPVHRKRMAVRTRGRVAVTRYEVLERFRGAALVRALPETGRTHQIRVHLAALGHPILGDPIYRRSRQHAPSGLTRQALHAESIAFRHPTGNHPLLIQAPMPQDLIAALRLLRAGD